MKISIITAFPELMRSYLAASVLGRGIAAGKLDVEVIDIRDFAEGDYRQIDDYCYGSGGMMLITLAVDLRFLPSFGPKTTHPPAASASTPTAMMITR